MQIFGEGKLRRVSGLFDIRRSISDRRRQGERPAYDADAFADYADTPYLTALVTVCSALGVFVGAWALIILLGDLHRGLAVYWPLLLILAVDVIINVGLRVWRTRRWRALGVDRPERLRRRHASGPTHPHPR